MKKRLPEALGETIEPADRSPAPEGLRLVQRFVNTYNHDLGPERDRLRTPERAAGWLRSHGLMATGTAIAERDRRRMVELREGLRFLASRHTSGRADPALSPGDPVAATFTLRLGGGEMSDLEPVGGAADQAIGRILAIVHAARVDGSWARLKACRQCGWAFYDRSKNRSGTWCSMSICGNRRKNRAYRRRLTHPGAGS